MFIFFVVQVAALEDHLLGRSDRVHLRRVVDRPTRARHFGLAREAAVVTVTVTVMSVTIVMMSAVVVDISVGFVIIVIVIVIVILSTGVVVV